MCSFDFFKRNCQEGTCILQRRLPIKGGASTHTHTFKCSTDTSLAQLKTAGAADKFKMSSHLLNASLNALSRVYSVRSKAALFV